MSKKVFWPEPHISSRIAQQNHVPTFKEAMAKAYALEQEQQAAVEMFKKAQVPMFELFKMRILNKTPLIVMRPINYQTSELPGADGDDFYGSPMTKSETGPKFQDTIKTIYPGTQLIFKSVSPSMGEFYFEDAQGNSYDINFTDKDQLLINTDIYETVLKYLDHQGDNN